MYRTFGLKGVLIRILAACLDVWWRPPLGKITLVFSLVYVGLMIVAYLNDVNFFKLSAGGERSPAALPILVIGSVFLYRIISYSAAAFSLRVDMFTKIIALLIFLLPVYFFAALMIIALCVSALSTLVALEVQREMVFSTAAVFASLCTFLMIGSHINSNQKLVLSQREAWGTAILLTVTQLGVSGLIFVNPLRELEIVEMGWADLSTITQALVVVNVTSLVAHLMVLASVPHGDSEVAVTPIKTRWNKGFLLGFMVLSLVVFLVGWFTNTVTMLQWLLGLLFIAGLPWNAISHSPEISRSRT